jgi:uncharacterized protein with ATP-grasp and redox domains
MSDFDTEEQVRPSAQQMFEMALKDGAIKGARVMQDVLASLPSDQSSLYATLVDFAFVEGQTDLDTGGEEDLFTRFRDALDAGKYIDSTSIRDTLAAATPQMLALYDNAMEFAYEEGRLDWPD